MSTGKWFAPEIERESIGKRRNTAQPVQRADGRAAGAPGMLLHMQRTAGNQAVSQWLGRQAVQRRSDADAAESDDDNIAARIQAKAGSGGSLDGGVQRRLEQGLGAGMSGVRVHTDGEADHLARSVSALAFTTGNDIFFKSGAYDPGSSDGMRLLAHEAAHTVQQASGPVAGTPMKGGVSVSDPSDSFEQAAEHAADHVVSGAPAQRSALLGGAATAALQRMETPNEEELQTMRDPSALQRVEAPNEEELQTMRDPSALQRVEAPNDELLM